MKKYALIALCAMAIAVLTTAALGTPTVARADGVIPWGGQGSQSCAYGCHWIVQCKDCNSVTLYINGTPYAMSQSGQGSWSVDSSGPFDPNGAVVSASYTGPEPKNTGLELSHANECTVNCQPPPGCEGTDYNGSEPGCGEPPECPNGDFNGAAPGCGEPPICVQLNNCPPPPPCEELNNCPPPPPPPPPPDVPNACAGPGHKNDPDCESDYHRLYIPHASGGENQDQLYQLWLSEQPLAVLTGY